jgi:hypothetical protein
MSLFFTTAAAGLSNVTEYTKTTLRMRRRAEGLILPAPSLAIARSLLDYLPIDLLRVILQYLTMKEIGTFDLSMTNSSLRPSYLIAMAGMDLAEVSFAPRLSSNHLNWLILREISASSLQLQNLKNQELKLISNCRQTLKVLSICSYYLIDFELSQIEPCPSLTSLSMARCHRLTDDGLRNILQKVPKIQTLDLSGTFGLTPECILFLVTNCSSIQHLDVSYNLWFDNASLDLLSRGTLDLKSINFLGTSASQSLSPFLDAYPNIRSIKLSGFLSIENRLLVLRRVSHRSLMSSDPELQHLGLKSFDESFEFYSVSDGISEEICAMDGVLHRILGFLSVGTNVVCVSELCLPLF